ncbi:MAG: AarF/ABC1/UbiB kinase family protein, partial [Okeania sp. SIO2H7]|nr:AarF/ABC1/UbiB kinase family protein [Okeania sp. SIO2H7]
MGINQSSSARRNYDPEAIARYYRYRPWLAIWRSITVIWYFGGFIIGLLWDKWRHPEIEHTPERATQLREIITRLGPTYIKVGQALSTRPDLIRKDFLEELVKLQDRLPPFDNELALA